MKEEQLNGLIEEMTFVDAPNTDSKDSISWHAHREAEKLSDESLYPILIKIIEDNPQKKKKDIRDAAYFILGKLLHNKFNKDACVFYIHRLAEETDKYVISSMLDRLIDVSIPEDVDISNIIECSKSDKWLIRHSALQALGSSSTPDSREALRYYINQDDEKKYDYEIVYANASMGKIGTKEDIPFLQKHIDSRKRDIRLSASAAIEKIETGEYSFKQKGMTPLGLRKYT